MFCVLDSGCSASWPLTVTSWCLWFRLQITVESPQLQSIKVVDISFVVHRPIPMVLATIETPQLRVDTVVDAPLLQVVRFSLSWCRGSSHGPDCSSDHRDSPVARVHGDPCPCSAVRASSTGRHVPVVTPRLIPMVSLTMGIPQFFIDKVVVAPVVQVERVPVPSCRRQPSSVCSSGRGRGGGDAGSLTPRRSAA